MGSKAWWKSLLVVLVVATTFYDCCFGAINKQQQQQQSYDNNKNPSSFAGVRPLRPSSVIFPIRGNVYPDGIYYVTLEVGEPPKPYYLDIDTGSDLTWLQCDAPCIRCSPDLPHPPYKPNKQKLVPCEDPLCNSVPAPQNDRCGNPREQCDYEIEYADEGSSLGVLARDAFSFRFANGSLLRPHLVFGCGYDQQGINGETLPTVTDGVLGLGSGKASIISQLRDNGLTRNVIGHCLSGRSGGYLFFGDGYVPSSRVTWTPMSRHVQHKYYSPGAANLALGKHPIGVNELPLLFDSGSSYTYLSSRAYEAFVSALRKDISGKPLKETFDEALPLCWKGTKRFQSTHDVKKQFKPLVLTFAHNKKAQLEITPESYLIVTAGGNVCLGVLNGTQIDLRDNIIGDTSMQDLMVIYDNDKQQIGWVRANCDRLPNVDDGDEDSFVEAFPQSHVTSMGILTEYKAPILHKKIHVHRRSK